MLTTVAYQLGPRATPTYALEGSVSDAGQSVKWLKENLQLFQEFSDIGISGMAGCDSCEGKPLEHGGGVGCVFKFMQCPK